MTIDQIVERASRLSPLEITLRDYLAAIRFLCEGADGKPMRSLDRQLVEAVRDRAIAGLSAADEIEKQRQKVTP